ncbi:MAG TPA: class I SAM-dependent methyltransferase [Longimicrobium sp.]|uniref:class I SAM-dependent methyltransferase n=1 Tax=Longimicrobium sp. TaxID=2029185 RepID=UPI002EDA2F25
MHTNDYEDLYALEESMWWFQGMREITAALLEPHCPPGPDRDVLDAGCGTGGMLARLAHYAGGGRVAGVDLVADALHFCRERGHRSLARASVVELPFRDECFDLVTSFDVLVQLPGEGSDQQAVREMFRVLRPGGIAFVRAAAYNWLRSDHDRALGSQRRYRLGALAALMEGAGFELERATYANAVLLPVAVVRRMVLKRLGLAAPGSDVARVAPALNRALAAVLRAEARLLRTPGARLPAGVSAICVARRPAAPGQRAGANPATASTTPPSSSGRSWG